MYDILLLAMIIVSILMIIVIAMQPTKTNSASTAFVGGAKQLFGRQKTRGFEAVLQKTTVVLGVLFFALALAIAYIA